MQQYNHLLVADDHHSLEGVRQDEGQPATSAAARREDCVINPGLGLSMYEKAEYAFCGRSGTRQHVR